MKPVLKLLLLACFLVPVHSFSWETLPGPSAEYRSILTDVDGDRLIIALYQGGLWQSEDGGETWLPANEPLTEHANPHVKLVHKLDPIDPDLDSLIVQASFTDLRSYDHAITSTSGESWTWVNPIPEVGSGNHFLLSDWTDPDHLLYLTAANVANSLDFGETWETHSLDLTPWVVGDLVQHPSNGDLFYTAADRFSSFYDAGAFISDSDGHIWSQMMRSDTLTGFENAFFSDMIVLQSGTILLSARTMYNGLFPYEQVRFNGLFRTEDGGYNWTIVEEGLPRRAFGFQMAQDPVSDRLYLWQEADTWIGMGLYQSLDDGLTFERVENGLPLSMNHVSNVDINESTGVAVLSSYSHGAWQTMDGGENWEPFDTGFDRGRLQMFTVEEERILARGWADAVGSTYSSGEEEWAPLPVRPSTTDSVRFALPLLIEDEDRTITFEATSIRGDSTGEIQSMVSTPDHPEPQPLHPPLPAASAANLHDPYLSVYQDSSLLRLVISRWVDSDHFSVDVSVDTGRTWNSYEGWSWYSRTCQNDSVLYAVNRDGVFRSTTNGLHWGNLFFPHPDDLSQARDFIEINPANGDLYVIVRDVTYRFDENGWNDLGPAPGSTAGLALIPGTPSRLVRLVQNNQQPTNMYISQDGGENWSNFGRANMPPYFEEQYTSVTNVQYDPWREQLWLSTPLGLVHTDIENIVGVNEDPSPAQPSSHLLLDAYPNPFNGHTRIQFNVPEATEVTLSVFDLQGRLVTTLLNESLQAGDHTTTLDANDWPSGTYFLRLHTPVGEITRKTVLVQ
ncbi:T9SS type A sorting domain-containing protein [bacterium]|nr:T9SS type A sorting domain-containing protein [bacterium]